MTEDIIKKIESLYVEGDEPTDEIRGLCDLIYHKDCPFCYHGMMYEHSEKVEGFCDCITARFKE